jgi:hypothetical protein
MKVTREVVADLWPVYAANEASADTRALVDAFLAQDPEFARALRADVDLRTESVSLTPEQEAVSFARTRRLVRGAGWLRGLRLAALVLTIFALMRLISDVSWDVSPKPFIADAVLATICWAAYCILLNRARRKALRM